MMKEILEQLLAHETLDTSRAREALGLISRQEANAAQIASFITVYLMRPITVEELAGFRQALQDMCIRIDLDGQPAIDVCGTGGDGKNTFNISTTAAFVIAGAGYKVVKHGNYGVSSVSGSSNIMEHFGYNFTNDADSLRRQLNQAGICFLHAPFFHPALKSVAPIRKDLGMKTFFNMLGPLVNPAFPSHQCTGVFSLRLARLYKYLLENTASSFAIIHALDGYDEITLTGETKLYLREDETIIVPSYFGSPFLSSAELHGGNDVKQAAKIFLDILQNQGTTAQKEVVLANAALAIQCFESGEDILTCKERAKISLESGSAFKAFEQIVYQH